MATGDEPTFPSVTSPPQPVMTFSDAGFTAPPETLDAGRLVSGGYGDVNCTQQPQLLSVGESLADSNGVVSAAFDGMRSAVTWVGSSGRSLGVGRPGQPLRLNVLSEGLTFHRPRLSADGSWLAWENHNRCGRWNVFEGPFDLTDPEPMTAFTCTDVSIGSEDLGPQIATAEDVVGTFMRSDDRLAWRITQGGEQYTGVLPKPPPNPWPRRVVHDNQRFVLLSLRNTRIELEAVTPLGEHLASLGLIMGEDADIARDISVSSNEPAPLHLLMIREGQLLYFHLQPDDFPDVANALVVPSPAEPVRVRMVVSDQGLGVLLSTSQGPLYFAVFEPGVEPEWQAVTSSDVVVPLTRGFDIAVTPQGHDLYWAEDAPEPSVRAWRGCN